MHINLYGIHVYDTLKYTFEFHGTFEFHSRFICCISGVLRKKYIQWSLYFKAAYETLAIWSYMTGGLKIKGQ